MNIKLFDTHTHLNFSDYNKDREKVIRETLNEGVGMIIPSTNFSTSKKSLEIAKKHPYVFSAVGLHPLNVEEENFDYEKYLEEFNDEKVKAIGETGLDYKPENADKEKQLKALLSQIHLAREMDLPLIFHCRKAHSDLIKILEDHGGLPQIGGVIHCFVGKWKQAKKYLEMGFYLGVNGIIFKLNLDKVIKKMPLHKILLETDSPYLSPPGLDKKRNEPLGVKYVAERIAKIKGKKLEEVLSVTLDSTKDLFDLE